MERRCATGSVEYRNVDGADPEIFGYALKFGVRYDMGWFTEEIHQDALTGADLTDVRILFNHDPNQILGRTMSGTAKVGVDNIGLWYRATLPKSPIGENVRVALERGDVSQSSWGFYLNRSGNVKADDWQPNNGKDHRVILSVASVVDASPVTFPANPDTSAAKRSFEAIAPKESDPVDMTSTIERINKAYARRQALNQ